MELAILEINEEAEEENKEGGSATMVGSSAQEGRPGNLSRGSRQAEVEDHSRAAVVAFECTLEKRGASKDAWGLDLDYWRWGLEALQVLSVKEGGSVSAYNVTAAEDRRVLPDDFIVNVNGTASAEGMVSEMDKKSRVSIQVARSQQVSVRIPRRGEEESMGVSMSYQQDISRCVRVRQILEGPVLLFNGSALKGREEQVRVCDFIRSANKVQGSALAILQELKSPGPVDLVLLRIAECQGI